MAISERAAIDKVEILENGVIQIRKARVILDTDGTELNRIYQRYVLEPGQDVSDQSPKVRQTCNVWWTPQVVSDYQAAKAASLARTIPLPRSIVIP